jgi:hypothetical protein
MAIAIAIGVAVVFFVILVARMPKGDLWKVAIPRTVTGQLAMGTRIDIAAALKKRGVPREETDRLFDGAHDQELLDRYWSTEPPAS